MSNRDFLSAINNSFQTYLKTGPRSNKKLKVLHGFIAKILSEKLGEGFEVVSLGWGEDREQKIQGRYINKNVDVAVLKGGNAVAGIAVKFAMSNYAQNSNNYFENMLGETANIRCSNITYFQVLILTQNAPYFEKDGTISRIEEITKNNLHKYVILSSDNVDNYLHSPDKTLLYIVKATTDAKTLIGKSNNDFIDLYSNYSEFEICSIEEIEFGQNVILNDFAQYIEKIVHKILSI
jgi:hypothetical protein